MIPFKRKNELMEQFLSNPHVAEMMSRLSEEEKPQVMQTLSRIFTIGESMNMMVSTAMANPEVAKSLNGKTGTGESGR